MITINKNIQSEILMTTLEEIVPQDSLFRKIDKYIDFTFIMENISFPFKTTCYAGEKSKKQRRPVKT